MPMNSLVDLSKKEHLLSVGRNAKLYHTPASVEIGVDVHQASK